MTADGCVVCTFYHITAAGNSISSQLDSPCQGNRYGKEKAGGMACPHVKIHTCRITLLQPDRRAAVFGLAFGLIGCMYKNCISCALPLLLRFQLTIVRYRYCNKILKNWRIEGRTRSKYQQTICRLVHQKKLRICNGRMSPRIADLWFTDFVKSLLDHLLLTEKICTACVFLSPLL
jgi:hypothetical protein